jgi:hypothetical protein
MRFYRGEHQFYCGIGLHTRAMYLCAMDKSGWIHLHGNLPTQPDRFLEAVQPFRAGLVVTATALDKDRPSPPALLSFLAEKSQANSGIACLINTHVV